MSLGMFDLKWQVTMLRRSSLFCVYFGKNFEEESLNENLGAAPYSGPNRKSWIFVCEGYVYIYIIYIVFMFISQ